MEENDKMANRAIIRGVCGAPDRYCQSWSKLSWTTHFNT